MEEGSRGSPGEREDRAAFKGTELGAREGGPAHLP